ncbi:hypothetical protein J6590_084115 [Homalodisca vitripennis]|nr:hypothetical protein J6590_084115 [Homalodisca vitripennis]
MTGIGLGQVVETIISVYHKLVGFTTSNVWQGMFQNTPHLKEAENKTALGLYHIVTYSDTLLKCYRDNTSTLFREIAPGLDHIIDLSRRTCPMSVHPTAS